MAYADLSYVLAGLRARDQLTATSSPTTAQAEQMLQGVEGRIDAALRSNNVPVPVTGPDSFLAWLREIAASGTRASILKVRYSDATGPNSDAAWAIWEKRYEEDMKRLWDGAGVAEIAAGNVGPKSYIDYPDVDLGDGYTAAAVSMETTW